MYKPEYIIGNETHKILKGFEIQIYHPIHTSFDLFCNWFVRFYSVKGKEGEKRDWYLDLAKELKHD